MAVSGVSGGGSSIYGNRNVLSGLASGMDTESMIENMTKATRAKIAQQKQKKTLLGWKQSAYQSVSTPLIEFSKKYMDYQSPTNLLSSAFFDQTIVTSVGKNSNLVSATGKSSSTIEINGVKQLATSAKADVDVNKFNVSDKLETKEFDINKTVEVDKLGGGTLTFQHGQKEYTIKLRPSANLKTVDDVAKEINHQLSETKVSSDETLASKIEVKVIDGKLNFKSTDTAKNTVKLTGASSTVKEVLELDDAKLKEGISLAENGYEAKVDDAKLKEKQKTTEYLLGKKLSLSLNGETKEIQLLTEKDLEELKKNSGKENETYNNLLQKKLDDAFGSGKFEVSRDAGKNTISLKVTDSSNIVHIEGGSDGIVGDNSIFGFQVGDGNRLNMNKTLEELGIQFPKDKDTMDLVINGVTIGSYKKDVTLRQIMRDINGNKEAGVKVNYSETSNKFVLTSSGTGTSSKIKIEAGGLGEQLFGIMDQKGTDAIIDVTVNGEKRRLTRSSNDIDIDGLKVTVSGTFGEYASDGTLTVKPEETVTFTSKPDTEKVFDAIKEMVEEYNKIVDTVYKQMTTKPNRDYKPLTDEQKKEMTKEQIEKWEEKAQEGLLFGDSTLRELHNSLRFIFAPGGEAGAILREIGLQPSDNYKESGKITLDEAKLKAALESDPEKVKNAFNALAPTGSNVADDDAFQGGVMTRLKSVFDKFASTSLSQPGILVQQAGSPKSANSMLNNILQQDIQSVDKVLDRLDIKLKKEIDRYNSKFTNLEKLVAQMNAQSGQLAGFMGGGM